MLADIEDAEIFRPIVMPMAIDVVNMLGAEKRAPDDLLHDMPMLKHTAPIDRDADVPLLGDFASLCDAVTGGRAIFFAYAARRHEKFCGARFANRRGSLVIVSPSDDGGESLWLTVGPCPDVNASPGTETAAAFLREAPDRDIKLNPAVLAMASHLCCLARKRAEGAFPAHLARGSKQGLLAAETQTGNARCH